ncbi:sugar ABC transporter substrate-binding protein [Butyrivibrio proteoclasticus B316]|uniref:Sugar ABC transporter substrate-binding protein n=1 Tax=Butyrivibrio proteoclasticus (strain ATCC 51982 / DSM 14932 / B316) TaxID=515622 RepID=E0RV56_BUTPB|nr:sugar ABC transporter substrate-binding protein [Butyrivibrio proteoclasticus]ADL34326.1 sugar ABC transporter substrate-binding protein [Butyrivibrio proteoclasticus B316]
MKKKVLSLLLSTAMVASLAACGSETAPADTTATETTPADTTAEAGAETAAAEDFTLETLNIVVDGTLTATVESGQKEFEEQWEAAVSEKLGHPIDLVINQLDHSDYAGTVSRLLTTGEVGDGSYPDALIMSATMLRQYQTTGLLWDMADAYANAEFQSRVTLPLVNENMKDAEGHLYGFAPTYGNGCVTYIKKSWLDAVGMKAEDIKTFDDYYAMLKAFTENDPDGNGSAGTYGVIAAGYGKLDEAPYINYMPEFWQGAYPSFYQKDGVWVDGFQEQATVDALARLAQGVADGVIDPDTEEAGTKQAREKFFSNDQTTSEGVFTYWAGTWLRTLTTNMEKQEVDNDLGDDRLVQLAPIQEIKDTWGGYLNREAPVWVITDDQDGNSAREQAIFDALLETMLDGDRVQTLWTYGAEDVHWSIHAEEFTTNADDPEKKKDYSYEEGEFHLKQSPNDPNSVWKKNHLDSVLVIAPLTNGYVDSDELVQAGNKFFTENCVDAPAAASCNTLTENEAALVEEKTTLMKQAIAGEITPEEAIAQYQADFGDIAQQILDELNAQ